MAGERNRFACLDVDGIGQERRLIGIAAHRGGHDIKGIGDQEIFGVTAVDIHQFDPHSYGHRRSPLLRSLSGV